MTGAFLGAAMYKIPVVIDGYISVVAALAAVKMAPDCKGYMFASHRSCEQGYAQAIQELGMEPYLMLGMRLGEGSGCPLAFKIIEGACNVMCDMATFEEANIDDDYLDEIRKGDCF
jgi:nicotinate-nucleotide--dimethylbenzimidazole phosphoribosyltransferase